MYETSKRFLVLTILLLSIFLPAFPKFSSQAYATSAPLALHASGIYILDSSGTRVDLYACNIHYGGEQHIALSDINAIAAMGFNAIRIHIYWYLIQPSSGGSVDSTLFTTTREPAGTSLDNIVNWCNSAGLYIILNPCVSESEPPPSWSGLNLNTYVGAFLNNAGSIQSAINYMYNWMASHYASNNNVIWESFNELGIDSSTFGNGATFKSFNDAWIAAVETGEGSNSHLKIIEYMVSGDSEEYFESAGRTIKANVVWAPHNYSPMSSWSPNDISYVQSRIAADADYAHAGNQPVMDTEWSKSIDQNQWQSFYTTVLNAYVSDDYAGWAYWCYCSVPSDENVATAMWNLNNPATYSQVYPILSPYMVQTGGGGGTTYTLTISVDSSTRISTSPVAGSYYYSSGSTAYVTATAKTGYNFQDWLLDGVVRYENPISVVMSAAHTLEAISGTAPPPPSHSLTISVNNAIYGYTSPTAGTYSYTQANVQVHAYPNSGYDFDHWILDGTNSGSTNPKSVSMNVDHTLQAVFGVAAPATVTYTLTVAVNVTQGSSSLSAGTHTYSNGTVVPLTALAKPGYFFLNWAVDGVNQTGNIITVAMAGNHSATAYFGAIGPTGTLNVEANLPYTGATSAPIIINGITYTTPYTNIWQPLGTVTIYYGAVWGYQAPDPQTVTITAGAPTTVSETYTLVLPQIPLTGMPIPFTAKAGTVWVENRMQTTYILSKDYSFHRISFFGSIYTGFDKQYGLNHYAYFSIWAESSGVTIAINEWFPTNGTTSATIIFSAGAAPISWDLYSLQFTGTVTAEGAVTSQSYSAGMLRVTTPASGGQVTINAYVTSIYQSFYVPQALSATITNLDDENMMYVNYKYYIFNATYWDGDGYLDLNHVDIAFSDGINWYNLSYTISTGLTSSLLPSIEPVGYRMIWKPSILNGPDLSGNEITLTFLIELTSDALDYNNASLYIRAVDNGGLSSGWVRAQYNYFNIYNIGGHTTTLSQGSAGVYPGGDIWELYAKYGSATSGSWVAVNQTWRYLQSYHAQFSIRFTDEAGSGNQDLLQDYAHYAYPDSAYVDKGSWKLDVGIYYQDSYGIWVKGWNVIIVMEQGDKGTIDQWTQLNCTWYSNGVKLRSDHILAFLEENPQARFTLWLNLWFNQANASSMFGGRVNPFFYGMKYTPGAVIPFLGSWQTYNETQSNSMGFSFLKDSHGDTISSTSLSLMKIGYNLSRPFLGSNLNYTVRLTQFDLSQPNVKTKGLMSGVPTPIPDKTLTPTMAVNPILAPLYALFGTLAEAIGRQIVAAMINALNLMIGFLDVIAGWAGHPGAISWFINQLNLYWGYMVTSLGYLISILTQMFAFLGSTMGYSVTLLTTAVSVAQSMITGFTNIVTGVGYGGVNLWTEYGGTTWLTLFLILYPMWLIFLWEEKGAGAVIAQITFIINVMSWVVSMLLTLAGFVIDLVFRIIEAIPVIE